jgi:hypothetical protein
MLSTVFVMEDVMMPDDQDEISLESQRNTSDQPYFHLFNLFLMLAAASAAVFFGQKVKDDKQQFVLPLVFSVLAGVVAMVNLTVYLINHSPCDFSSEDEREQELPEAMRLI